MNAAKAKEILQLERRGDYDGGKADLSDAIQVGIEAIEFYEMIPLLVRIIEAGNNGKGDNE